MENSLKGNSSKLNERISLMFILYAAVTIALYTLPMLKITIPYIIVAPILLASLLFLIYKSSNWLYFAVILCIASLLIAAINLLTGVYALVDSINEMIRNIRFFVPVLWGCFALKYCTQKQRKFLLVLFGIMCGYILIKTFDALQEVPDVCRELAKSTTRESVVRTGYRMQNVGGFEYSYMMGIVTLGFVWTAVKAESKLLRIICALLTVVCYFFIIQTMYTLLLILTFIGTVMIFFFTTKNNIVKALIILGSLAMLAFMEPFFKFLSDLFSFNYGLQEKFESMYLAIRYDDVSMVGSRPELLWRALLNWAKNPIFGGIHEDSNSHSFVMSILENSGLVGFAVWSGFIVMSWRMLRKAIASYVTDFSLFDCTMVYLLLLSFFNPTGYIFELVFASFFIIPIWCSVTNLRVSQATERGA